MKRALERSDGWGGRGTDPGVAGEGGEASSPTPPASPPSPATTMQAGPRRPLPDSEVEPKAQRRQFSVAYKLRILEQAERCQGRGELGALLRREGLYASHLGRWRALHRQGGAAALGRPRGRKPDPDTVLREQLRRLERDNQRLQRALQQAETILEVQKKLSEVLGIRLTAPDEDETSA
jgi:transposase